MKCRICQSKAVIRIERHNTAFCGGCFSGHMHKQVERAVKENNMFTRSDAVLVAVSGGKDSLVLWDILLNLGYQATGLHVDLGIGEYSRLSREKAEKFAAAREAKLIIHDLRNELEAGIPEVAEKTDRPPCSACGLIKRYTFNRIAGQIGFSVLATGHNLDDEAARLLGNVLRWQHAYIKKQSPVLPALHEKLVKKVKPLCLLAEREVAAHAILHHIDYIVEECPNAKGAKLLVYKEVLNRLEEDSPGTKDHFYRSFLRQPTAAPEGPEAAPQACGRCGQLTFLPEKNPRTGERKPEGSLQEDPQSRHPPFPLLFPESKVPTPLCGYCRLIERM